MKRVMSRLHIHIFISFTFLCLIFQEERHFFSFRPSLILYVLSLPKINADCVFLASALNRMFVSLEIHSQ